ncbi:MAG: hypothetical protein EP350_01480 [Alphaproteobacteria bacterium]|nr:MAG: hypothetical protein EP350_01480 [Alphaproteobacteria bacterium]
MGEGDVTVDNLRNRLSQVAGWIFRAAIVLFLLSAIVEAVWLPSNYFLGRSTSAQQSLGIEFGEQRVREIGWREIDEVEPEGAAAKAGLQKGDGLLFDSLLGARMIWRPGEVVPVTVDRDGQRFRATMVAQEPVEEETSNEDLIKTVTDFFMTAYVTVLGVLLLVRGRKNRAATLLGIIVLAWSGSPTGWLPHWAYAPFALLVSIPVEASFTYCWPLLAMEISGGHLRPWQSRIVPPIAIAYMLTAIVDTLLQALRVPMPFATDWFTITLYLTNLAFGLAIVARNYRQNDAAARNRIKVIVSGFAVLFFGIVLTIATRFLFDLEPETRTWMGFLILAMTFALITYAVLSKKLFDFGFAVNRTLVFGGVTSILLTAFGLLEWGVEHLIPKAWHEGGPFISAGIALGLFLIFHRLRDFIERHIERLFFSSWHRAEAALRRFVESASHFDRIPKLSSSFVDAISRYAQGADTALYLRDRGGSYRLEAGKLDGVESYYEDDDPIFALMRHERGPVDLSELPGSLPGRIALPMLDQGTLAGFALVAARPDGAHFRPDEIENLGWATHQVGLDLRALRARQLEEQVQTLTTLSAEKDRLLALLAAGRTPASQT